MKAVRAKIRISKPDDFVVAPDVFVELGKVNAVFPLYTMQDMADRWGKSIQTVKNWEKRYAEDFPKSLPGMCRRAIYPRFEVERFEQVKADLIGKSASIMVIDDPEGMKKAGKP